MTKPRPYLTLFTQSEQSLLVDLANRLKMSAEDLAEEIWRATDIWSL